MQTKLGQLGYLVDKDGQPLPPDNNFGPGTNKAVKGFQGNNHLHVDGVAGPTTRQLIDDQVNEKMKSQTESQQTPMQNGAAAPGMDPALQHIFNAMQSGNSAQVDAAMQLNAQTYFGSAQGQAFLQNTQNTAREMMQAQQQTGQQQQPEQPEAPVQPQGMSRTR